MEQFIGEIRMFGGNYAPDGWFICDGSVKPISDYDMLYTLIGTTYGGNGQSDFGIPDLRGRAVLHNGNGPGLDPIPFAQLGGKETVTLKVENLPSHLHMIDGAGATATTEVPTGMKLAMGASNTYVKNELIPIDPVPTTDPKEKLPVPTPMHPKSITPTGGNSPVSLMQPYVVINYIISYTGVFPSQP
ncbi:MAG: phage tail protein [Pedobacter sp.]|nr:MAG: phage tail protein [Pedobacter sp.]